MKKNKKKKTGFLQYCARKALFCNPFSEKRKLVYFPHLCEGPVERVLWAASRLQQVGVATLHHQPRSGRLEQPQQVTAWCQQVQIQDQQITLAPSFTNDQISIPKKVSLLQLRFLRAGDACSNVRFGFFACCLAYLSLARGFLRFDESSVSLWRPKGVFASPLTLLSFGGVVLSWRDHFCPGHPRSGGGGRVLFQPGGQVVRRQKQNSATQFHFW